MNCNICTEEYAPNKCAICLDCGHMICRECAKKIDKCSHCRTSKNSIQIIGTDRPKPKKCTINDTNYKIVRQILKLLGHTPCSNDSFVPVYKDLMTHLSKYDNEDYNMGGDFMETPKLRNSIWRTLLTTQQLIGCRNDCEECDIHEREESLDFVQNICSNCTTTDMAELVRLINFIKAPPHYDA